jgi:hypothetical protein
VGFYALRDHLGSRPVEIKARFRSPDESRSAMIAALSRGSLAAQCCSEDAFEFHFDFVQHPIATSIAATVACTLAGLLVGLAYRLFAPASPQWLPGVWVSGLSAATLGALSALWICRSALSEYRLTRELTGVRARVQPDHVESITAEFERHGAIEIRVA